MRAYPTAGHVQAATSIAQHSASRTTAWTFTPAGRCLQSSPRPGYTLLLRQDTRIIRVIPGQSQGKKTGRCRITVPAECGSFRHDMGVIILSIQHALCLPVSLFLQTSSNRNIRELHHEKAAECAALQPFERMGLVLEYFRQAGNFTALHSESLRGLPRPQKDKYAGQLAHSDPVFAVWGHTEK